MFARHKLTLAWSGCLLLGLGYGWAGSPPPTRLTFLAVGQGACAVFQHQGATVLIDAGPKTEYFDAGERIVVPRLRRLGARSVDLILISHPDTDHLGGAGAILKAYPKARLGFSKTFRGHPEVVARLREWGVEPGQVLWLEDREKLRVGHFTVEVANPGAAPSDNDGSMFVRITNGTAHAVFSGDASEEVEARMAAQLDWDAQILHAGHHGSRSSTGEAWLREVDPVVTVISCGRDNTYGHPHPSVLQRLAELDVKAYRTDQHGELRFQVGTSGWLME